MGGCISTKKSPFLIIEGIASPFAKEIEETLTKHYDQIKQLSLSESLNYIQEEGESAIVICDVSYREQESDINQLSQLGTKLKNMLIFYIVPDEYSQLQKVPGKHIQEATLHRTHGNFISQQDDDTIHKALENFISGVGTQIKNPLTFLCCCFCCCCCCKRNDINKDA